MILISFVLVCICASVNGNSFPEIEINQQLKDILLHLRQGQTGIPGDAIPDPMGIPDFESSVDQAMAKLNAKLSNVSIEGLSLFLIDTVETNLAAMNVHLGLNFSQLTVKGQYVLDGSASFVKVKGNGEFWMIISNAYVTGLAQLAFIETNQLQLEHIHLDIKVKEIKLHFENLLGGGFFAKIVNSALNAFSPILFETVKPSITGELSEVIKEVVNEQLLQIPALPIFDNVVSPLDDALETATSSFVDRGLEPLLLPSWEKSFSREILWLVVSGQLKLENGKVKGLSTLYRTGNVTLTFHNNTLNLAADLGFDEILGGYTWYASFMGLDKNGAVHIRVTNIELKIVVSQVNKKGSSPKVDSLIVSNIEQISTDIDGLGTGDFALEFLTGAISNVFKHQLMKVIQESVKQIIQENLSDIKIPF